jgi:hypothetical protein
MYSAFDMHKDHLKAGSFIHLRKDKKDTFGVRLLIKEIRTNLIICKCLTDGTQKSFRYLPANENLVWVEGYAICNHLSEQDAIRFIKNRRGFLTEQAATAQQHLDTHKKAFRKFVSEDA